MLLVVLTLLQLCRAEIKDVQPQWYSANIINDGFQPKSISELFSTEASFSTANPIIVSAKNSNDDILQFSTVTPPTSYSSTTSSEFGNTNTSPFASSSQSSSSSSSSSQATFPQYSSTPSPFQQNIPCLNQNQQSFQRIIQPSVEFQQQSSPTDFEQSQPVEPLMKMASELQSQPQRNVQIQQDQSSTQTIPTLSQDMRFLFPQDARSIEAQTIPPQSNYFLIYQQGPQSIGSYPNPTSSPRTTVVEQSTTTEAPPLSSTFAPTFSSPSPSFSTVGNFPTTTGTSPLFYSPVMNQQLSSSVSPRVTVTSLSTFGSSSSVGSSTVSSTSGSKMINCMLPRLTTPIPRPGNNNAVQVPLENFFPLKIRVLAPSGSITNVNFNPIMKTPPVQKYVATTTTRKPTTRRTPKPRKNTYERCLQGCRKNGQTLCAAPVSQYPIDPKTLRGFPSVCHMACHNSYRKDAYEKIIDGSCSKLRTRIRPIDSDSKLKRDELQKMQYILDNSGHHTVLELTGAYT